MNNIKWNAFYQDAYPDYMVTEELKKYLINNGLIVESSSELDLNGISVAINWLKNK